MDESVPAHRDAPASSSRESASEPRGKMVYGQHSIDTLWWYKTWLLSGYNLNLVKRNFSGNTKELAEVLRADQETNNDLY